MAAQPRKLYPLMLSVSECAEQFRCDRKVIYQMTRAGLPLYRLGVRRFVLTDDVIQWVRQRV
jgi:hypothetical protein